MFRTTRPLVGLACCACLAAAQGTMPPEVAALERTFRKTAKPEALQAKRTEALAGVRGLDSAEVAVALVRAFQRLESECAPIVKERRAILLEDSGLKLDELRSKLQPLRTLQEQVHRTIARLDSDGARQAIAKLLAQKRLPLRLRLLGARVAAGAYASGPLRSAKSAPLEDVLVVLEAVASLGRRGGTLGDYVVSALSRREPIARERAIATLAAIRWPGGLKPLIDRLAVEPDEILKQKIGDALCVLTKQNLGVSTLSWNAWFQDQGASYLSGERRLGGGKPHASKRTSQGYYFGIPLDRSSILFVHDNSLSMRRQLGDKTRIQRSLEELGQALDNLKPTQKFNIVLLANRVWAFETKQVPATKRNVARAQAWLQYQPIELGTNIYNALEAGFVFAGRGVYDRYYEPAIDTILLLSDGAPTRYLGRNRGGRRSGGTGPTSGRPNRESPKEILAAVQRWNLFGRIEIHTIVLGGRARRGGGRRGGRGAPFMEKLAKQNNGRFEQVSK